MNRFNLSFYTHILQLTHLNSYRFNRCSSINRSIHMDSIEDLSLLTFLKRQNGSCVAVNGETEISRISSKNIFFCVLKEESRVWGLERHEG